MTILQRCKIVFKDTCIVEFDMMLTQEERETIEKLSKSFTNFTESCGMISPPTLRIEKLDHFDDSLKGVL